MREDLPFCKQEMDCHVLCHKLSRGTTTARPAKLGCGAGTATASSTAVQGQRIGRDLKDFSDRGQANDGTSLAGRRPGLLVF